MLDIDEKKIIIKKRLIIWSSVTVFLLVFGQIYECFSHGIFSYDMILAFVYPLVLMVLPYVILYKWPYIFSDLFRNMYYSGVITLTLGSVIKGGLKIYGTSTRYIWIYYILGVLCIVGAIVVFLVFDRKQCNLENNG